jgi:hypothetical protein
MSMPLPAGSYVLFARLHAVASGGSPEPGHVKCRFESPVVGPPNGAAADIDPQTNLVVEGITLMGYVTATSAITVSLTCGTASSATGVYTEGSVLTAVRIGALHVS